MEQPEELETVEHLIQTSGLSVEDLLKQLQKYKALKHANKPIDDSSIPTSSTNDDDSCSSSTSANNATHRQESAGILSENKTKTSIEVINKNSNGVSPEISSTTKQSSEKSYVENGVEKEKAISPVKEKIEECKPFPKLQVKSFAKEKETVVRDQYSSLVHKALLMDHDYDKGGGHSDSEPDDSEPVDSTSSLENVRDNLRMQLSFLRTKKKDDLPILHTTGAALPFNANLKRKRRSEELDVPLPLNDIVSLSDETEFVIMDVTGGVDRVEDECIKQPKTEEEKKEGECAKMVDEEKKIDEGEEMKDKDGKKVDEEMKGESEKDEGENEKEQEEGKRESGEKEGFRIIDQIISIRKRKLRLVDENESTKRARLDEVNAESLKDPGSPSEKAEGETVESPFVSNTLDEFLNENLKLNVSYPIPKLGAEDGIKTTQSPFEHLEPEARSGLLQQQRVAYKRKHNIKAKTLAEMRRQMGLTKRKEAIKRKAVSPKALKQEAYAYKAVQAAIKQEDVKQEVEEDRDEPEKVINPEALKREASKATLTAVKQEKEESNGKIVLAVPRRRSSFVMYGKRMLWLPSYTSDKCIGKVEVLEEHPKQKIEPPKTETPKAAKHISILSPVLKTSSGKFSKYKPGPLCKKKELLRDDEWTVEMRKMPQVYLQVTPEVGKPICQEIEHLLPLHENIVTAARAEFALSMLKESDPKTRFIIPVSYAGNRNEVLIRKQKPKARYEMKVSEIVEDDPSVAVQSVVDALLDFVERQEDIDKIVEKYDDEAIDDSEIVQIPEESESPKDDKSPRVENKKGRRKRTRTKVDYELLRLNCKIIDVQENLKEEKACQKTSCRLGCVCKSLACDGVFSAHCQLVECMFDCTCPLPVNLSDKLSTYTLNHLDGEAKKNLAKVEREFTQTIIHAGNDTIVMGAGGRNKARRSCKQPKKYSDFVQTNLVASYKEDETWTLLQDKFQLKKCTVDVPTLELDNAVPLCIVHGRYCCWCNGMITSPIVKKKKTLAEKTDIKPPVLIPVQKQEPVETPPVKKPATSVTTVETPPVKKPAPASVTAVESPSFCVKNPIIAVMPFSEESSARLREVSSAYRLRNKTIFHFKQIVEFADNQISRIINDDDSKRSSKRKQSFAVREEMNTVEDGKQYKQLQKVIMKEKKFRSKIPPSQCKEMDEKIFDEEIKIPLSNNINAEMVEIIGEENANLSLLPWPALMRNYKSGLWTIWCLKSDPKKMVCTKKGFEPPLHGDFANIKRGLYSTPVIDWILKDELPDNKPIDRMHFLLAKLDENNFEVKGVCMKNSVSSSKIETLGTPEKMETLEKMETKAVQGRTKKESPRCKRKVLMEESEQVLEEEPAEERKMPTLERMDILPRPQKALKKLTLPSNRCLKCSHKNISGETKCLILLNRPFDLRRIRPIDATDPTPPFDVPLPRIGVASKWLLVYLNSDFSYLNFTASQYSIKYNDLMDVVTMAKNLQKTIILRNNEFTKTYINISFGIFCVPTFQDRLFIGPFARSEEPNVETLRFLQGSLVNTYIFNKMRGRVDARNSVFMEEVDVQRKPATLSKCPTVSSPTDTSVSKSTTLLKPLMRRMETVSKIVPALFREETTSQFDEKFFFTKPFITGVTDRLHDQDKQTPNRIVVTNIPHFGHFFAYQDAKHFDLFWPDGRTSYRFHSASFAKEVLKCYLHNVLYTVPESFKINIVILTTTNNPQSEVCQYLGTHRQWVVGDFGICQMDSPRGDVLKKYGIKQLTSRATCPRRHDENVSMIIRLFGLLFLPEESVQNLTVEQILYKVKDKVSEIEDPEGNAVEERSDLVRTIEQSKSKLHRLNSLGSLMIGTNKQATTVKSSIPTIKPTPKIITETIEIIDSEDEDTGICESEPVTITKLAEPAFQRILQSGKIQHGSLTPNPASTSLLKKPESTSLLKKPESTSLLKKPESTSLLKKPESTSLLKKPESTSLLKKTESASLLKKPERIFPKPTASLVSLLKNNEVKVLTTSGVPVELMVGDGDHAESPQNGGEANETVVLKKPE